MGVELPLSIVDTILECYDLFSGVKLSIRSFCFIYKLNDNRMTDYGEIFTKLVLSANLWSNFEKLLRH